MPDRKSEGMTPARFLPIIVLLGAAALSACTSSTDVLEPNAIASEGSTAAMTPPAGAGTAATPGAAAAVDSGTSATTGGSTAAIPTVRRLQFAPVVGAPVEAAGPLSERLAQLARARGITIARTGDTQGHVLKGYFSALPEGKETTIVYVWDVLDTAGNRLHRIQGQLKAPGGDGWASVTPTVMQTVADQTMEQLGSWLGGSTG